MSQVYLDDREAAARSAVLKTYGLPSRPPGPRRADPETERRMARLMAVNENRKRLQRIKIALQNIVDELADGARRKHAFEGFTREERCLEMLDAMLPDLELLEIR